MATFDNASKAGDGVRAAANWLQSLSERSVKAATGAAARAATGRGVEGAVKLAARGVDDAHLAFRDVLHTVEGQDVFRGLTPEAQNQIIANATETNRLLAEELKQVQSTEPGTQVRTFSARDSDAPSQEDVLRRIHGMRQELAPVSKTYDTQPTPKEDGIGTSRRLAGPTSKTVMKNAQTGEVTEDVANTPRPEIDNWLERISRETEGDIQTRTALPEVPGGDLRKVKEVKQGPGKKGGWQSRYPGDIHSTLNATIQPAEINKLLAEVMTAHLNNPSAGILQPDEIRALAPHFKSLSAGEKGDPSDQLALDSVAKVVDSAFSRLGSKADLSEAEASLRDKGLAWQKNQTLYKPGTRSVRNEASMEPYDKSEEQVALDRATSILGTGVTSATPKTLRQAGGEAIAEGADDLPTTAGSGARRAPPGSAQKLMESIQRKRSPISQHLMTAENPDGTLRYPDQALQTALEDIARIEPNENWNSFDSAIVRAMDYINENRKASGLPPANFGRDFERRIQQKSTAVEGRIESDGASPASDSVEAREAHRKRTFAALKGIRDGLEQMGAKNPVLHDGLVTTEKGKPLYYTLNPGTPVDKATMSPVPTSNPAGDVMPGTARDPANVPPAPKNVAPRPAAPVASDISTDKHIADVVAGKSEPTEALVEALQARQSAIDAKRQRGDGAGADADQKALDEQTSGWNWKGTEAPAPKQGDAEALPDVPASIDLGTAKKGRQRKPKAEKPAETPPPAAPAPATEPAKPSDKPNLDAMTSEERIAWGKANFGRKADKPAAAKPAATPEAGATAAPVEPAKPRPKKTTDATPIAPPAAAKPEPVKAPESRETMELAAKQMGMTPEEVAGMDDPALYKRLTEKAASGQEPFKGGDARFVKRKYRTGEVDDGENLPDVPSQKVLDAGTRGEMIPAQKSLEADEILPPKEAEKPEPIDGEWSDVPRLGYKPEPKRNPNTAPEHGPIHVNPKAGQFAPDDTKWAMPPEPSTLPKPAEEPAAPKVDASKTEAPPAKGTKFGWKENLAATTAVTTAAGIAIANARRKQGERGDPGDILGPTYRPQNAGHPQAQPAAGAEAAQPEAPDAGEGGAFPAPTGRMEAGPDAAPEARQDNAALEAMKAEQVRQDIAARREAVESTLKRIGNVRGMGTYGPAFY